MKKKVLKYKHKHQEEWKTINSVFDLVSIISKLKIDDTLTIKIDCKHKNTFTEDGLLKCNNCKETLEVLSYRD